MKLRKASNFLSMCVGHLQIGIRLAPLRTCVISLWQMLHSEILKKSL